MKRRVRLFLSLLFISLIFFSSLGINSLASRPSRHVAMRYAWSVIGETEWSGTYHYTKTWMTGQGTDSGRRWVLNLTKATAYGVGKVQTRWGR